MTTTFTLIVDGDSMTFTAEDFTPEEVIVSIQLPTSVQAACARIALLYCGGQVCEPLAYETMDGGEMYNITAFLPASSPVLAYA